jgi:hypothetical protein
LKESGDGYWPIAFHKGCQSSLIPDSEFVISIIIVIFRNHGVIVIRILIADGSSASPGAGRNRWRRSSVAPSYHYLSSRQVISMKE